MIKECDGMNNKERIIHIAQILTRVLILPIMCAISYGTKSYVPMFFGIVALIILLGISRIKLIGQRFKGNDEEKQTFKKIVIRSIILAPILVAIFITIVILLS